jgi:hypothetical protein
MTMLFSVDHSDPIFSRCLARAYDYGRKGQTEYDDVDDEDDLGMTGRADYFTRGEGSQNFTFGGRAIEERAETLMKKKKTTTMMTTMMTKMMVGFCSLVLLLAWIFISL